MRPPTRASSLWQQANRKPAFIQRFAYRTAKSEQGEKVKCKYLVTALALRLAHVSLREENSYLWQRLVKS